VRYHPLRLLVAGRVEPVRLSLCVGARMSENRVEKDYGPVDRAKDVSGIYGLGFEKESFMGFMLPFVIVGGIGGLGALLIIFWLS
jgi:hypothetical protein